MLSIRSKLTVIFSLLSAAILLPLCLVTARLVERTIQREEERSVQRVAESTAQSVFQQWDEDFLGEFGLAPNLFSHITGVAAPWAAVRGDGTVLHAPETLTELFEAEAVTESRVVSDATDVHYRLASFPLIPDYPIRVTDLPEAVRKAIYDEHPQWRYLRAKIERVNDRGITEFDVQSIAEDGLIEILVEEGGRIIEDDDAPFPPFSLSQAFIERHLGGFRGCSCESVKWTSFNGQLIIAWQGADEGGASCSRGVNRVGETFVVGDNGEVVEPEGESRIFIVVAQEAEEELGAIASARLTIVMVGIVAWLALSLVGWFVARVSMAPIRRIVNGVEELGDDLDARIPERKINDEVAEIQSTVNSMLDRLEEGIDRERQFLSNASHELRSPLAKLRGELDLALHQPRDNQSYEATLRNCASYVESMERLVESLLIMARLDNRRHRARSERADLCSAAMDVVGAFDANGASRLQLDVAPSERPYLVNGEEALIKICLRNVVENALRYSPNGTPVSIRLFADNGSTILEVEDSGPGIPAELRQRVLDRFFRIERSRSKKGGGCGIGLSITKSICEAYGANIELRESDGGGTCASLRFAAASG